MTLKLSIFSTPKNNGDIAIEWWTVMFANYGHFVGLQSPKCNYSFDLHFLLHMYKKKALWSCKIYFHIKKEAYNSKRT